MVFYTTAGDARGELERLVNLESRYVVVCQRISQLKFVRRETSEWKFTMSPPHLEKREIDARRRLQALNVHQIERTRVLERDQMSKNPLSEGTIAVCAWALASQKDPTSCARSRPGSQFVTVESTTTWEADDLPKSSHTYKLR